MCRMINKTNKWYEETSAIILLLIFFFPVGLYLMWKYTDWAKGVKIGSSILLGIAVITVLANPSSQQTNNKAITDNTKQGTTKVETKPEQKTADKPKTEQESVEQPKTQKPSAPAETVSQRNAVSKAKDYLRYTAFSYDGLVAQLEYEKFPHDDAVYGADHSGADWMEQATKKAKDYMSYSSFSRGSLIAQLEYEKFTPAQAEHGADSVGL